MKRTLLVTALIAATLAPVAAQAQDSRGQPGWQQERRDDRQDRRQDWRQDRREDRRDDRQDRRQDRRDDRREWRQDNRADQRQDWQRRRETNRSDYRRGNWRAPFTYRRFDNGGTLPRNYWGSRYYVNDWNRYRLPSPGHRSYRYVRHYDDVLLVDTRNGRVIRVYRNFYW